MLLHRIKLENILSFGPDTQDLELKPLNVLIGPNASGKSNLIEVIGLLRAAPGDVTAPVNEGGGAENWIWRGEPAGTRARVEVVIGAPFFLPSKQLLSYSIAFGSAFFGFVHLDEELRAYERSDVGQSVAEHYLERSAGRVVVSYRDEQRKRSQRELPAKDVAPGQSILSQLKDPVQYRELWLVAMALGSMRLYREWSFGRNTPPRLPQKADLPNQYLEENGANLGMVLSRLRGDPKAQSRFLAALRTLYQGVDDFHVHIEAGSVQVFLQEGGITVPATRLSDGTLRYLCLIAILCDPNPSPLVCIEEPELGLHPDILPGLADLLREASERCQLIVTTHSDTLVDALTDTPESIVICEKEAGQTKLKRLDKERLSHWLGKYRLGELWTSGELGGNRW